MKFKYWLLAEENSSLDKQTHVFDFDDTIAVTQNPNIVMLFQDGLAAHKSEKEVLDWLRQNGLKNNELLKGPNGKSIEIIASKNGYACYVSSSGLAKIQSNYPGKESIAGVAEPLKSGPSILTDFTTAFGVDHYTAKPIKQTIEKIKKLNAAGADTMVLTARRGEGKGRSIHGHEVEPTNKKDILSFLNKQGATPTDGVIGTAGGDKGKILYRKAVEEKPENEKPEEIHFYDDAPKNINNVSQTIGGKINQDLYLYGPGDFESGQANVYRPNLIVKGTKNAKNF